MAHCLAHVPADKAFNGHKKKSTVDKILRQGGKLTAAFLKLIAAGINSKDGSQLIVDDTVEARNNNHVAAADVDEQDMDLQHEEEDQHTGAADSEHQDEQHRACADGKAEAE